MEEQFINWMAKIGNVHQTDGAKMEIALSRILPLRYIEGEILVKHD